MNFSAAGVNSKVSGFGWTIYTAAANRGTSGLTMHVFGIGHIAAHCGSLKKPMHSVHFTGSIANAQLCSEIASFGHSLMHAEHPMQRVSLIIIAIVCLLS
jgi:hypothetical protein